MGHIAGNEFAYCNRLRVNDFMKLFSALSFKVLKSESNIDQEALNVIQNSFPIDEKFFNYTPKDLSTTGLRVMLFCG